MSRPASIEKTALIGREFGNVVLVRELGRGAMGAVYVGYQKSLKRQVAVKLLPKSAAAEESARRQFRDEAETVAVLSHPYIVPIFEIGEDEEFHYHIMQLIEGADLGRLIQARSKHPVPDKRLLPPRLVLGWVGYVLEALEHAHAHGVVHQDMKPGNIMIEKDTRRPLVVDFGIARTARAEYWAEGMIVGTLRYAAPEQAAGRETDARSDIYSMGLVLLEGLAGGLPLRDAEDNRKLLLRKVRRPETLLHTPPSSCSPHIDERLERIILRAVAPSPDDRFRSCREFRAALSMHVSSPQAVAED